MLTKWVLPNPIQQFILSKGMRSVHSWTTSLKVFFTPSSLRFKCQDVAYINSVPGSWFLVSITTTTPSQHWKILFVEAMHEAPSDLETFFESQETTLMSKMLKPTWRSHTHAVSLWLVFMNKLKYDPFCFRCFLIFTAPRLKRTDGMRPTQRDYIFHTLWALLWT